MRKLRFEPTEITKLQAQLVTHPYEGDEAPKPIESSLGTAAVYPSASKRNIEYRCIIRKDDAGRWEGMCSCRGWGMLKKSDTPRPCIHIFDA